MLMMAKKYALMHRTEDDMYTCSAMNMKESVDLSCHMYVMSVVGSVVALLA